MAPDSSREEECVQKVDAGARRIGERSQRAHGSACARQSTATSDQDVLRQQLRERSFAATDTKVSPGFSFRNYIYGSVA